MQPTRDRIVVSPREIHALTEINEAGISKEKTKPASRPCRSLTVTGNDEIEVSTEILRYHAASQKRRGSVAPVYPPSETGISGASLKSSKIFVRWWGV